MASNQYQAPVFQPRGSAKAVTVVLPKPEKKYSPIGARRAALLKGKRYMTRNYMAITEKENKPDGVSRAVLSMAMAFEQKYVKKWRGRHIVRPADLERYVIWLYLTGSRKREPFLKPYPRISISRPKGYPWRVIKIIRIIEKSFIGGTKERTQIEQDIPIFDSTEDKLWRKVLSDYETLDLDDLFGRLSKLTNLHTVVQHNFHCDMREPPPSGKLLKDAPITPHSLRHHRAYNLYLERGLEDGNVVDLFGWADARMLRYYSYMHRGAAGQSQMQALKRYAERLRAMKK